MTSEPTHRVQFGLRHLLLLMAALAAWFGVLRWILIQRLPQEQYPPLLVWASIAFVQLTAAAWMLAGARRRREIDWQRGLSILLGLAPLSLWIACLVAIATPPGGTGRQIAELAVSAALVFSLFGIPALLLAIVANLWNTTDRLLLTMQLAALASSVVGFYVGLPMSLLW